MTRALLVIAIGVCTLCVPLDTAAHPQTILASEMNGAPLPELHGAPLRLRVENQLGFKMVKWIQAVEFVETVATVYEGEGGYHEDREYFGELALFDNAPGLIALLQLPIHGEGQHAKRGPVGPAL